MQVVLLSSDLMMQSRIQGALSAAGATVQTAMSAGKLSEIETAGSIVVIDLATPGVEPAELIPALRQASVPPAAILAFGPHVQEAKLQAASAAGCDAVFARGQFLANAADIVREFSDR